MRVARLPGDVTRDPSSVVTVGTFDGVHRAHREIIRRVVERARAGGGRSVVVTFDPHPKEVVASVRGAVELLTTVEERAEQIAELGVDLLALVRFTAEFSRQSSREFYEGTVLGAIGAREVVVGYDHMFGRDRAAGVAELEAMGRELGFGLTTVEAVRVDGEAVSSTRVRRALAAGDVERAEALLGRPYALSGTVVAGDGRGRGLGFPTANIAPGSPRKLVPGGGVYVVSAVAGGARTFGMMNIGVRPTVSAAGGRTIEVHLLGFEGDLYGATLRVEFHRRLREERRFPSAGALAEQLARDRDDALAFAAAHQRS